MSIGRRDFGPVEQKSPGFIRIKVSRIDITRPGNFHPDRLRNPVSRICDVDGYFYLFIICLLEKQTAHITRWPPHGQMKNFHELLVDD